MSNEKDLNKNDNNIEKTAIINIENDLNSNVGGNNIEQSVKVLPENNNEPVIPNDIGEKEVSINSSKPVVDIENNLKQNENNKAISKSNEKVNNNFYEKERKIWPIVLIIILAVIGFGCYYYFIMTKPINIIKKTLNNTYESIKKNANLLNEIDIKTISGTSNIVFNSNNDNLKAYNGLNIKVEYGSDLINKNNNYYNIAANLKNEKLLDVKATLLDKKVYLDFKDIINKIVYTELFNEDADVLDSFNKDKINNMIDSELHIVEVIKDAIINNISEDNLSKKMLMKEIDSKKIPAIEVKYHLNYNEYKKIYKAILDAIVNDSKSISFMSSVTGISEYKLKDEIIKSKDNISELSFKGDTDFTLTIDAIANKLLELVISDSETVINVLNKKDEIDAEFTLSSIGNVTLTIDKKENKIFMDVKMMDSIRVSLTAKVESNSDKEMNSNLSIVIYNPEDINKEMANISAETNIELNKNIKSMDVVGAVNIDDLSESDQEKLMNVFMPVIGLLGLEEVDE